MAITRDGATLYTAGLDGKVILWDLSGARRLGRPFKVGRDSEEVPRYALRPDGRVLAIGQPDGTVALFDTQTLRRLSRFSVVPEGPVRGIGYVPGSRRLVVGGDNGFLALVDPQRGTILRRLPGHRDMVFTFTADGRLMATASGFDAVRLYALPSGQPVGRPLRGPPAIGDVSLSPDGQTLRSRALLEASRSAMCRPCPHIAAPGRRSRTWRASRRTDAISSPAATRAGRDCGPPRPGSRPAAGSSGTPDGWSGSP